MANADYSVHGIIYCITNTVNGKRYIGQTTMALKDRWRAHKSPRSGCRALSGSIQKYGAEVFAIERIDTAADQNELNAKERHYISMYRTIEPKHGYNRELGGISCAPSAATRRLISEAKLGKPLSAEHRKSLSDALKGVPLSAEHGLAISQAKKGQVFSDGHRAKLSAAKMGWKMPDEHKAKFIGARYLKPISEETKRKISEAQTGRKRGPLSDETKAKLSAANKGRVRPQEDRDKISEGRRLAKLRRLQQQEAV